MQFIELFFDFQKKELFVEGILYRVIPWLSKKGSFPFFQSKKELDLWLKKREEVYALKYLMFLLSKKSYSIHQLREKLVSKGIGNESIAFVLTKVDSLISSDGVLISHYIEKKKEELYGPFWIQQKLYQQGFSRDQIDFLLSKLYPEKVEKQILEKWKTKYGKRYGSKKDRFIRAIINRGFKIPHGLDIWGME